MLFDNFTMRNEILGLILHKFSLSLKISIAQTTAFGDYFQLVKKRSDSRNLYSSLFIVKFKKRTETTIFSEFAFIEVLSIIC